MSKAKQAFDRLRVADLEAMSQFATGGIVSKRVAQTPTGRYILFCMDAGQELTEHTASVPAGILVLRGKARIKLGRRWHDAKPGTFIHMPAELIHAVKAQEPLVFFLVMFKGAE